MPPSNCELNFNWLIRLRVFFQHLNLLQAPKMTSSTWRRLVRQHSTILKHFYEDVQGRDGHGHASESKETLGLETPNPNPS